MNVDTDLIPFTKINSKWAKDLNKMQNYTTLEDNIGENLNDFRHGDDFLGYNTKDMIHERQN